MGYAVSVTQQQLTLLTVSAKKVSDTIVPATLCKVMPDCSSTCFAGVAKLLISSSRGMPIVYRWLKGPIVLLCLSYRVGDHQVCNTLHEMKAIAERPPSDCTSTATLASTTAVRHLAAPEKRTPAPAL